MTTTASASHDVSLLAIKHTPAPSSVARLVFDPRGEILEASRRCEADVFLSRFGNTREQLDAEYGAYDGQSVFVSLLSGSDDVIAAARLITPGARRLKTLVDCGSQPWFLDGGAVAESAGLELETTWDVATVSVRKGAAASVMASAALYHGLVLVARANGVTHTVAVLDERVRGLLASVGLFYRALPGAWPAPYLGSSASTPTYMHFPSMLDEQRRRTPDGYRLVSLGVGLDGVSVPPLEHFVLRRPLIDLSSNSESATASVQGNH